MVGVAHDISVNMTDIEGNVKLKNIDGKLLSKINKHEDNEENGKDQIIRIIKSDVVDDKLEINNPNDGPKDIETEIPVGENEKCDRKTPESDKENDHHKKGILKYERTYSNKHVDFNMDLEFVPFDEAKDYTIEIQIVEQMPKKIVSYAALFAQQKKDEEEKLLNEAKEKRKHKIKRKVHKVKNIRKHEEDNYNKSTEENQLTDNISNIETTKNLEVGVETDDEDGEEEFSENSYLSDNDQGELYEFSECVVDKNISEEENLSHQAVEHITTDSLKPSNDLTFPQHTNTEVRGEKHHLPSSNELQSCQDKYEFKPLDIQKSYKIDDGHKKNTENYDISVISQNTSNHERLSVPLKKLRSHSLTDLEAITKKLPPTIVQLSNEINLILSRQQEEKHSKQHKLIEKKY